VFRSKNLANYLPRTYPFSPDGHFLILPREAGLDADFAPSRAVSVVGSADQLSHGRDDLDAAGASQLIALWYATATHRWIRTHRRIRNPDGPLRLARASLLANGGRR
jgi:hypothetical protein